MKSSFKAIIAASLAMTLVGCSAAEDTSGEIQIPIYGAEESFETVEAKYMDLEETQSVGASIGYALSDALSAPKNANLISVNVHQYQEVSEGDVIAVFDSSALNYTYLAQEIVAQSAYEAYRASGSEADRITWEYEQKRLEAVQYEIDSYTVKAPYDGIITDVAMLTEGEEMEEGTYLCSVAHTEDIYVYINVDPKSEVLSPFQLGSKVNVTLTGSTFEGTVVSYPKSTSYKYGDSYVLQDLGWGGFGGGSIAGTPTSADSDKYVIIGFEPDVLAALLEETPNAASAGWATAVVTVRKMNNVLCVPANAVTSRENTYVYLYENGQKLRLPIDAGPTINGYTVVLSGLKAGDQVIV